MNITSSTAKRFSKFPWGIFLRNALVTNLLLSLFRFISQFLLISGKSSTFIKYKQRIAYIFLLLIITHGLFAFSGSILAKNTKDILRTARAAPVVTATVSGALTCSTTSVTLSANSTSTGLTYQWTGPNSFTSTLKNPIVTVIGTYTVVATNLEGSGTASVSVTQNINSPGASATVSGNLACTASTVTLTGSSSTSGVTYGWTGPNNFTSTSRTPSVSTAGVYTLTVTNPANGCTSTQTIQVNAGTTTTGNLWLEDFTLANGTTADNGITSWSTQSSQGNFSVNNNEFRVNNNGNNEGTWTSGAIDITGKTNITASADIRSGVSTGGALENSGSSLDYIRVYYKLDNGAEVLFNEQLGSINSNSSTFTNVSIGSLSGSTIQIIIRARATSADEFYYFDNAKVVGTGQSGITATASVNGQLTCSTTSVTLSGTASVSGATFRWLGPNGFTSNSQNTSVSVPGNYSLTASTISGCTGTTIINVIQNITGPDVTAAGSTLPCSGGSTTITASTSISSPQYTWSGPNNFTSTAQNPTVTTTGAYTVTVRNPSTGCTTSRTVQVVGGSATVNTLWLEDFTLANGTAIDNGTTSWSIQNTSTGAFSVNNNEFRVNNIGTSTEGIWSSGIINISSNTDVSLAADFRSTGSLENNGSSLDYIRVFYKLNNGPEVLFSEQLGSINGNSTTYSNFSVSSLSGSTVQIIIRARTTTSDESYYFDNIKVSGKASPVGVITASVNGTLSCVNPSVQLSASVTTSGATYSWIAPNGSTINSQNPVVTIPGNYTAVVKVGLCQGTKIVTVPGSSAPPDISIIGANLSCTLPNSSAVLTTFSSIPNLVYSWSGPGGISSNLSSITAITPGTYIVSVTNPVNSCTNSNSFVVGYSDGTTTPVWTENFEGLPDGTMVDNGSTAWSIDISKIHTVDVSDYSGESGLPYYFEVKTNRLAAKTTLGEVVWTSQPIDISAFNQVQVKMDISGQGSLNDDTDCGEDCFDYDYVNIYYKVNGGPDIPFSNNGSFPGKLALSNISASTGIISGNTVQIIFKAYNTGNNEFYYFDNITVSKIDPASATISASASGPLTCTTNAVTLTASPDISGATYNWSGPGGFTNTGKTIVVAAPGTYTLSVTGTSTCSTSSSVSVVVEENKVSPVFTVNTPDILTCLKTSTILLASSSSSLTYIWTRPDASTFSGPSLTATTPGTYNVTAVNPLNGCFSEQTIAVQQSIISPGASAAVSGILNCSTTSVTLTASSPTPGVTFGWAGPGGFISSLQNPTVSAPGTYTLTVTNPANGCISISTTVVNQNIASPGATASVSGTISCTNNFVTLLGSSPTSGVTYRWTGPNSYVSTIQNSWVGVAGNYVLTVTNPANGCTSTTTVNVTQSTSSPGATAGVSGSLNCTNTSVTLIGNSATPGVTYSWTGPGSFTSTVQNPSATVAGTYTLTVTNPANGCASSASVSVIQNTTTPNVAASVSGPLNCSTSSVTLTGSSTTSGVTYSWTGPNSFTSTSATPSVTVAGTYTLTVTNPANGCTASTSVSVLQNSTLPGASASVSGILNCSVTSVTLSGSSPTSGVTYSWAGPGSFTSTVQNPSVTVAGTYTLTVTNPSNGCTSVASAVVSQNIATPGATASVSGSLTCSNTSVTLSGSSATIGVTYGWIGPGSFTSSVQNPSVTVAGTYTLTVTNPANGCKSIATVNVTQSNSSPGATASVSGSLTCTNASVTLSGSSATPGVTYSWAGPGSFTSTVQNPSATVAGTYTLTVTNPANGCTSSASVNVIQNTTAPNAAASVSGPLNCSTSSVTLTGSSTTSGVTYSWTGPNSFTSTSATPSVAIAGTYSLTVTNPANGCTASTSVIVIQNSTLPGATAFASGALTCSNTSVTLTGSSPTSGVTFSWTGPGSFTSTAASFTTSTPGNYIFTVTNPTNGCISSTQVNVLQNINAPGAIASVSGPISCTTTTVNLSGSSPTTQVTYSWTGPGSFTSSSQNPSVSTAGTYTLTVTNPANGCTSTTSVTVIQNVSGPGATATASGVLTCTSTSVTIQGSSATSGVTYSWTGPNSFSSSTQNSIVSLPGAYTLTVTNPANGCTSVATVNVTQNIAIPNVTASVSGQLNCLNSSVTLTGASTTSGATFKWTGPNNFNSTSAIASVAVGGTYTLVVTNPTNGCTSSTSVNVIQNSTLPGAVAFASGALTCNNPSVTLTGTSPTSGVTLGWTGPGNFTSSAASFTTSTAGSYIFTVTNPANGCISSTQVIVLQNTTPPGATTNVSGQISCANPTVTVTGSSTTSGVSFLWTGPNGFTSSAASFTTSVVGTYTLTVTNSTSGCTSVATANVVQNTSSSTPIISVSSVLSCTNPSVILTGSSPIAGALFSWTGPNGFTSTSSNPTVTNPGTYVLTTTDPANGCTATAQATVQQVSTPPGASASVSGVLNCATSSVNLVGSSPTAGVNFKWTGPSGVISTVPTTSVAVPGTYTLTVTNPVNECISTATVIVQQVSNLPGATASASGTLTCTNLNVTLTGSSPTAGVSFKWTGPNGFIASTATTTTSNPGNYILTVTNPTNGCISTANVSVQQNVEAPGASASVSGLLTCTTTSVTLTGSSSLSSGVTFLWTGPGGLNVASANASATVPGVYTLKVTNTATSCTSTTTVEVQQNIAVPTATASVSGPISCTASSVTLTGSSTSSGVSFRWTGPGGFTANSATALTLTPGTYTLTVTNPLTGCFATASVVVIQNVTAPNISASVSGSLTCSSSSVNLVGSSSTAGATFQWVGPNGFTSTAATTSTSVAGTYTLTVTNPANGCTATSSVSVTQNGTLPGATATASGFLSCIATSITLSGNSNTAGVTYSWAGPGSFTATTQNVTVSAAGAYTLTVTNPANGCISTANVNVAQNTAAPSATATASSGGVLTCTATSTTLSGSSTTSGVTYAWTGPGSFTATTQNVTVSIAGTYTLKVTNPINGCFSNATVNVTTNTTAPNATATASSSGVLTCTTASVTLSGSSSTAGVTYSWTGPGSFTATTQNVSVSTAGTYTLKVTNPANGCFSNATVNVTTNTTGPGANISSSGSLTCTATSVTLSGSSATAGVTYSWTGPGSFTATTQNVSVSTAGVYTLTVTNPANGCISTTTSTVTQDGTLPNASASASSGGILTCTTTSVTLSGSSTTAGVTYSWTGPGSFTATTQNVSVSTAGAYIVKVTNPANGCFATATVNVSTNTTAPSATATAGSSGILNCTTTALTLSGSSTTAGVTYEWTGPGSFAATTQNVSVSTPGTYTLKVTNPTNGCFSTATASVTQNITAPGATASASSGGIINCTTTSVILSGSSATAGVTYSWTGPGSFTATTQNVTVSTAGTYTLKVTNPTNGCFSTATVGVTQNGTLPSATANASGSLTCTATSVTLTGSSNTAGVTYSWTGPGSFTATTQNVSVGIAGTYTLKVTNPANGCFSTANVNVSQNTTVPGGTASVNNTLTCTVTSVIISGSSSTSGVAYSWTGPNSFVSTAQSTSVSVPGTYTLKITNPVNGCTTTTTVAVLQNIAIPDLTAPTAVEQNCITINEGGVSLTANSTVPNAQYSWTVPVEYEELFPVTNVKDLVIPFALIEGDFIVTVTNPVNGCTNSKTVQLSDNATPPVCFMTFRVSNSTLSVETTPGAIYTWSVNNPSWSIASGQGTDVVTVSPGPVGSTALYSITISTPSNGCSEDCSLLLTRTPTGIVATTSSGARFAEESPLNSVNRSKTKVSVFPNPFNEKTAIKFTPAKDDHFKLEVYTFAGKIGTLFDGDVEAGKEYEAIFDGKHLAHGIYFYRIISKKGIYEGKLILAP